VKVGPKVCHQLGVGRVIRRLDADDLRFEGALVPVQVQVSTEVELRVTRTGEKNLTAPLQGMGDLTKVLVIVVGVVPDAHVDLIGVAMDVQVR
jgi:hypothetical protein